MMKIAWFTPFCRASAIGHYSALILDQLTREHEVTVFATGLADGPSWRPDLPARQIDGQGGKIVAELANFDMTVYNMGDCPPFHKDIYLTHLAHPGVVILHDLSMWNFFHNLCGQQPARWLQVLEYAHGSAGRAWGQLYATGWACREETQEGSLRWNLARAAVHGALGVVVHSRFSCGVLAPQIGYPIAQIDFPAPILPELPRPVSDRPADERKASTSVSGRNPNARVRLLTFGILNPNKAVDMVIEALARSPLLRERCEYVLAGQIKPAYAEQINDLVRSHGLEKCLRLRPPPDDDTLHRLIAESDVLVNLRYPHLGESSWSLLEGLWQGKAMVVWRHGYYDEFPDDVVSKVASLEELTQVLERLVGDADERQRQGENARNHARQRFRTDRYCERLVSFLEDCLTTAHAARLADRVGQHLRFLLGGSPANLAGRVAEEIQALVASATTRDGRDRKGDAATKAA